VHPMSFGKMLLVSCIASIGFASTAHADGIDVSSLGDDTYSITREAKTAFNRDVDKLKASASDDAAKYCSAQGKQLKVTSLSADLPKFGLGYAKAKIIFMALNSGDPRLTSEPAPAASAAPAQRRMSTDDLYKDLLKLDDLRKKGILTDEEFQAEKKKLLSRSN
jgi:hypothetical protein